jgi:hypothetical protein
LRRGRPKNLPLFSHANPPLIPPLPWVDELEQLKKKKEQEEEEEKEEESK